MPDAGEDAEKLNSHSSQVGIDVAWLPQKTVWPSLGMLACAFPKTQQLSSWAFIPEKSEQTCSKTPYVNVHSWFLCRSQKCGSNLSSLQWMRVTHWGHLWNETQSASEKEQTWGPWMDAW